MKPVIIAGEPTVHAWCPACQLPSRVRVPLHLNDTAGEPVSVLEICPGCGTGHDRPRVELAEPPRVQAQGNLLQRAARKVHAMACRHSGLRPLACAYADCQWPGFYRVPHSMRVEDGTMRYVFCRKAHRAAWANDNRLRL